MNTLIPLEYYATVYYNLLFLLVLVFVSSQNQVHFTHPNSLKSKNAIAVFILFFIVLYMGTRPISFTFGDMGVYAADFKKYAEGAPLDGNKDVVFNGFMKMMSGLVSPQMFFFICSFLYVIPLYFASKKIFQQYWPYAFVMLVVSLSFWAYGTNGIRNGLATSLFVYALSFKGEKKRNLAILLPLFVHFSLLLPIIAYFLAKYFNSVKYLIYIWFGAIILSLLFGGVWENFFFSLGLVEEDRLEGYFFVEADSIKEILPMKIGFRWDFLLYSFTGVYAGWFFLTKKGFKDKFYAVLYGTFIYTNAVWILVIRANFSNRFAYLSWFLLGLVIIYPLLKSEIVTNQKRVITYIILGYFAITYLLTQIYK